MVVYATEERHKSYESNRNVVSKKVFTRARKGMEWPE